MRDSGTFLVTLVLAYGLCLVGRAEDDAYEVHWLSVADGSTGSVMPIDDARPATIKTPGGGGWVAAIVRTGE